MIYRRQLCSSRRRALNRWRMHGIGWTPNRLWRRHSPAFPIRQRLRACSASSAHCANVTSPTSSQARCSPGSVGWSSLLCFRWSSAASSGTFQHPIRSWRSTIDSAIITPSWASPSGRSFCSWFATFRTIGSTPRRTSSSGFTVALCTYLCNQYWACCRVCAFGSHIYCRLTAWLVFTHTQLTTMLEFTCIWVNIVQF